MYKSDLSDLFLRDDEPPTQLEVIIDEAGEIKVDGAKEIELGDFLKNRDEGASGDGRLSGDELLIKIFNNGLDNRQMRETDANLTSSRSHLLFTIKLETEDFTSPGVKSSKMTFIDLAGSERLALIGFDDMLYEEALFINESLRCLEKVITNLTLDRP